jgi:predicted nucleotidyltransferase
MPSPGNTAVYAVRAIDVALGLVEQQEERLRAIIESKQSSPQEKFEALVDLAHLAGILLHEMGESEAISQIMDDVAPPAIAG